MGGTHREQFMGVGGWGGGGGDRRDGVGVYSVLCIGKQIIYTL